MTGPPAGVRFQPPATEVGAEVAWLLQAAFGPDLPERAPANPSETERLAGLFDLGPRIVARHGANRLKERLGTPARALVAAHRRGVAMTMAADRLAQQLTSLAAERRRPFVFLKGYALYRLLGERQGARPFVDLDVLLAPAGASDLQQALLAEGWESAAAGANPQHLPPLASPEGLSVDIHYRLRGVQVTEQSWATADELLAGGLCRPLGAPTRGAWMPEPHLLAAHIATHAIEQHGQRPATYPLLRAVADLADLSAAEGGSLEELARPLVRHSLAAEELRALFSLARTLTAGDLPCSRAGDERDAELLLRHILAGVLNPDYQRSLSIDHAAGRLRQARQERRLVRYIADKLVIPAGRPQPGKPVTGWRALRQRFVHPLRLGGRLLSAAVARLRRSLTR